MAFEQRNLDDYIDVAQRIADFRDLYPDGSLQAHEPWRWVTVQGFEKNGDVAQQTFVVYVAAAYRTPDDPRPGIGVAWEVFPGRTPYTRGSELQNAETSAWGRAIIAVGASDSKRGIASREEVRNRQAERDDGADRLIAEARALRRLPPEVDEHGAATQAEIMRMSTGPEPGAERVHSAVDDRWTTDAPSWAVGVDPPEDQPGSILPAQRSQIMALYTALGIKDRNARLRDITITLGNLGMRVGGPVESVNVLSHHWAGVLLEALHDRQSGKMAKR